MKTAKRRRMLALLAVATVMSIACCATALAEEPTLAAQASQTHEEGVAPAEDPKKEPAFAAQAEEADVQPSSPDSEAGGPQAPAEPDPPVKATDRFSDVKPGAWYVDDVQWALEREVMSGYDDGSGRFGIGDTLSRAQLAALLANYAGADTEGMEDTTGIADVASGGAWYTGAVNWAVASGVITGYDNPDGTKSFAPDDPVTRQQAATILARFSRARGAGTAASLSSLNAFPDAAKVARWADDSMAWAVEEGVVSGASRGGKRWLDPARAVLREEIAKMVHRAADALEGGTPERKPTSWVKADGSWRYRAPGGSWTVGWAEIDGARYYFDEGGALLTGWLELEEGRYYLEPHGPMATGWVTASGSRYYLGADGLALTGWQKVGGAWYDLGPDGRLREALGRQEWLSAVDGATPGKRIAVSGGSAGASALDAVQKDIDAIVKQGYSLGFVLLDLTTGATISYNAQTPFYGASTTKGPFACAIAAKQPEKALRYKGVIEAAVNWSSNSDYLSLRNAFGDSSMQKWMGEANVSYFSPTNRWPTMRPCDLAKLWVRNYEFLSLGEGNARWLAPYFRDTSRSFIDAGVGARHAVYSKAGWIWDGPRWFAYDDAGYVDKAGSPYVVAIMSAAGEECGDELRSLAAHLDAAHDSLIANLG